MHFLDQSIQIESYSGGRKGLPSILGAPDKPCGVGRADANPKLLLNDT